MDYAVRFVLRNLVIQKNFDKFQDSRIFHDFRGNGRLVTPKDKIFTRILGVMKLLKLSSFKINWT